MLCSVRTVEHVLRVESVQPGIINIYTTATVPV